MPHRTTATARNTPCSAAQRKDHPYGPGADSAAPLRRLFEVLAGPCPTRVLPGSFYRSLRVVAVDGTTLSNPAPTGDHPPAEPRGQHTSTTVAHNAVKQVRSSTTTGPVPWTTGRVQDSTRSSRAQFAGPGRARRHRALAEPAVGHRPHDVLQTRDPCGSPRSATRSPAGSSPGRPPPAQTPTPGPDHARASREVEPGKLIHHADYGCQPGTHPPSPQLV